MRKSPSQSIAPGRAAAPFGDGLDQRALQRDGAADHLIGQHEAGVGQKRSCGILQRRHLVHAVGDRVADVGVVEDADDGNAFAPSPRGSCR